MSTPLHANAGRTPNSFTSLVAALAAGLLIVPAHAQTPPVSPMKPGLWEINVTNQTVGKDAKRMTTSQICILAADIESGIRALPPQQDFGMKCATKDYKLTGDAAKGITAKWQLACTGKAGTLNGPANITLKPESYEGQADLMSVAGGKTSKVAQSIAAKRVAGC